VFNRRFRLESDQARELLARKTERADGVIVIDNMKALDFERFIEAIYRECVYPVFGWAVADVSFSASQPLPLMRQEHWTSILRVAHRFGFASQRKFAIKQLLALTSPIDRIVLAHEFGVNEWLKPAYVEVSTAREFVSDADIDRLGLDVFKKLARVRDRLKAFIEPPVVIVAAPSADGSIVPDAAGIPRPLPDATSIVEDIFQLRPPVPAAEDDLWSDLGKKKSIKKGKK
jgi:hypothetical protein